MAIKDFYPAIRPALDLNFAGSRVVDPRITFSRSGTGSIASYFDEKGVMKFAPPGMPRIDFDPIIGECKGLLIEEQRTNLLKYSEQFDNAAWLKINVAITDNATTAPDGTLTADKLVENNVNAEHYIDYVYEVTSGQEYTMSVYAKKADNKFFRLRVVISATERELLFNFDTGAIWSQTLTNASVVPVGNGWYRFSGTFTATATGNTMFRCQLVGNGAFPQGIYAGDGTSGIYLWGAQLEQGAFPTSYIPTTSAQVTRASDVAYMTGVAFQWYKQGNSCIVADVSGAKLKFIACLDDGTASNRIQISIGSNAAFEVYSVVSGAVTNAFSGSSIPANESERAKISAALKTGSSQVSVNGQLPFGSSIYTGDIPSSLTHLRIGSNWNGGNQISGHIRRIAVYPSVFQNAVHQSLSA